MPRSCPVTLRTQADVRRRAARVLTITLVIDQNPAPMAAKFKLGADANVSEISTRVRDQQLHRRPCRRGDRVTASSTWCKTYVKASGGCSAPAAQECRRSQEPVGPDALQEFAGAPGPGQGGTREAQIMIGHPNNSGLQMDQVSQLYIPALFVNRAAACGRTTARCCRWRAASRSPKTPIFASLTSRTAQRRSAPKPRTPTATSVPGMSGRSMAPACDAQRVMRHGDGLEAAHFSLGLGAPDDH